ncbi:hypothetical protein FZEAL_2054 [Fusarium zealandicum]|uniref:Phenol 2-monooxygenase n=1 Tax=Fusarium zealandicum TaxID=1053134 RepID=A0A8H4URI5_9HYPO|nr:hypothetical protein FZEAL_2054 [Fusarium zealandicum]
MAGDAQTDHVDVLIVGAGPAGLMMATWLAKCGVKTRIVDKRGTKIFNGQADGLQSRTLEIFDSFGFAHRVWIESKHVLEISLWNPDEKGVIRRSSSIPDTIPGISRFQQVALHQGRIERFFLDAISEFSQGQVSVERGVMPEALKIEPSLAEDPEAYPITVQLRHLSEDEARPKQTATSANGAAIQDGLFRSNLSPDDTAEMLKAAELNQTADTVEVVKAKYMLGADGAHSWVRKELGFKLEGESTDYIWGVLDIVPITDFPDIRMRCAIHSASSGSVMVIPRENKLVRLYIQLTTKEKIGEQDSPIDRSTITPEGILKSAQKIMAPYTLSYRKLDWWTAYQIGQRVGSSFSAYDRVFLAGDAVHTHSPKAGQGMNISMQDSFNLGWKIANVVKGLASRSILKTYESERKGIALALIEFDHKFSRLFSGRPAKDIMDEEGISMESFKEAFEKGNRFASGIAVDYERSSIVWKPDSNSTTDEVNSALGTQALASEVKIGMRIPSVKVLSQSDARPWHLQELLPSNGTWRVILFPGDIGLEQQQKRMDSLCDRMSDASSFLKRFTPPSARYDSTIEVLTVHASDRHDHDIFDFPQVLRPYDEVDGWDYDKIFADNPSYHEGHGRLYESFGISPDQGCVVVVRPDQYVSYVGELDDYESLDTFFSSFMIPQGESKPHPDATSWPETTQAPLEGRICRCCFNLNTFIASKSSGSDTRVDPREGIVCVRRKIGQIIDSSKYGCQICSVIVRILDFFGWNSSDAAASNRHPSILLRLPMPPGNPEISRDSSEFIQLYTHLADGKTWRQIRPLPEVCTDHLSNEALAFMRACIRTCHESHQLCSQVEAGLPTRLLDVGQAGEDHIRLIECEPGMTARYAALSYCWGSNATTKTLAGNMNAMKSGIALTDLPPTYVDAIVLTRNLGVRYLWIDALCIIQDSQMDWERECSQMADIYSKAFLTIAAASTTSATQHFLRPHLQSEPDAVQYERPLYSEQVRDGEDAVLLKARVMLETGAHWKWQQNDDERPLFEPITRRGWTLQERLSSTRLLSVSSLEMEWACKESVFCECHSRLNHQREFGQTPLSEIIEPPEAFRFWHKVVENYSKRRLSKPRDKLPAVSAIAATVQKRTGSEYVAGLWKNNIDLDLLWRAARPSGQLKSEYKAPTFSWASMDGEVDYYCFRNGKHPYQKTSAVLAIEANPRPSAPLGCVDGGQIVIRGPLSPGIITGSAHDGWLCVGLGGTEMVLTSDTMLQTLTIPGPQQGSFYKTVCRWTDRNPGPSLLDELQVTSDGVNAAGQTRPAIQCWALRLGSFSTTEESDNRNHEMLVLGRSPMHEGVYERLGLGSWWDEDGEEVFRQERVNTITIA